MSKLSHRINEIKITKQQLIRKPQPLPLSTDPLLMNRTICPPFCQWPPQTVRRLAEACYSSQLHHWIRRWRWAGQPWGHCGGWWHSARGGGETWAGQGRRIYSSLCQGRSALLHKDKTRDSFPTINFSRSWDRRLFLHPQALVTRHLISIEINNSNL